MELARLGGTPIPLNDACRGLSRADRKYIRENFLHDYDQKGANRAWPFRAVTEFART
jgi:hypothetical protein